VQSGSLGKDLTKFIEAHGHDVVRISSSLAADNHSSFTFNDLMKGKISRKIDIFLSSSFFKRKYCGRKYF